MKTHFCSTIPIPSFYLSCCTTNLILSNQKRNAEPNQSISLSKNLKQRLHSAPHSHNSLLLTNLRINDPGLTRPQIDPIRVPPRLLLATEPLAQLLDLVRVCSLVLNLDIEKLNVPLDGSLQTESREEDNLQVRHDDCLVGVVAEVLRVAAVEVDLLEVRPGGGHGEPDVRAAHGFPAGVVGVEEFLEGCEGRCGLAWARGFGRRGIEGRSSGVRTRRPATGVVVFGPFGALFSGVVVSSCVTWLVVLGA